MNGDGQGAEGAAGAAPAGAPDGGAAAAGAPAEPQGTDGAIDAAREKLAAGADGGEGGEGVGAEGAAGAGGEGEGEAAAGAEGQGAEGAEGAGQEGEGEGEGTGEEEHPEWSVTLDGIDDRGEAPIELEAPDEETFNRLNRLRNEAAIGRNVRQERRAIQRQREELEVVDDMVQEDPVGFIMERIPEALRVQVATQLLFEPGVLDKIDATLRQKYGEGEDFDGSVFAHMQSPERMRLLRAELRNDRHEMQNGLRGRAEHRKALRAVSERIFDKIDQMIPESITGDKRGALFDGLRKEVTGRIDRLGINNLDDQDVELLVSSMLRAQGVTPAAGNGRGAGGPGAPQNAAPRRQPTADELKQARDRKRRAAAAAPPGVGAPGARARPELGKTTDEVISNIRKVGLRRALGKD